MPRQNLKGKDLFSASIWKNALSASTFYIFIASLRKKILVDVKQVTRTHGFIRVLRDTNRLIRCYTQNIDGLEAREGLCTDMNRGNGCRTRFSRKSMKLPRTPARQLPGGDLDGGCEVVQLHGNLAVLKCSMCRATCEWEEQDREAHFQIGEAPPCPSCEVLAQDRRDRGKRGTAVGFLRPNIVLYGEEHPSADSIGKLSVHDLSLAPDLLLILGTSLQVHGLKLLVKEFAKSVHARNRGKGKVIFVNLSKPSESVWKNVIDYWVSMDCDEWVDSMRVHRPDLWHMQTELGAHARKPQLHTAKKRRDYKEVMLEPDERGDSSEISQDVFREPKGIISMNGSEGPKGETEKTNDAKGDTSGVSPTAKLKNMEAMKKIFDGLDGRQASRIPESDIFLGSGLKPESSVYQAKKREPLQIISAKVLNYSLKAPPSVADLTQVLRELKGTSKPNETQNLPCQGPTEPTTNQQLLTPPSSGHRSRSQGSPRKRCQAEEADIPPTPVKRSKTSIRIWQDGVDGLNLMR